MPTTLAFSCEVVHEKLGKYVNICKSYGEKSMALFYVDTVYRLSGCENFVCRGQKFVFNMFDNFKPV